MNIRILVVDDEELLLRAVERVLRRLGFDVHVEKDPRRALDLLAASVFDIVVSDHFMPAMSGVTFLTEVHARHPTIIRVLMIGSCDHNAPASMAGTGIDQFIEKPWLPGELQRVLGELGAKLRAARA